MPIEEKPATGDHWFESHPWNGAWVSLTLSLFVLLIDWLSGPFIRFPAFFILPVLLAAWNQGFGAAASIGLALCLARLVFTEIPDNPESLTAAAINALLRAVVFVLIAFLAHTIARQTRSLREEVRQMEGILPICGFCKAIRDDKGCWQNLETYVLEHSDASFTHGLCPECTQRHYGQFLKAETPPTT